MPSRIEDYAIVGNCETVALVGRDGSIDWLGLPRFDSPVCFAALLGQPKHGRWLIGPSSQARVARRYLGPTLILETVFRAKRWAAAVVDFMFGRDGCCHLVRLVRGLEGEAPMRMELVVRFDYGSIIPWVSRQRDGRLQFIAGPDRLLLETCVPTRGQDFRTLSDFSVAAGQEIAFSLSWSPSHRDPPPAFSAREALERTESFWTGWAGRFKPSGPWDAAVLRSLLTLKALAHKETGGIVAAGTTSLPEKLGGSRNWDYRFCWLRDAAFTLLALTGSGYLDEARDWHQWLLRAVAGAPADVQTLYGVAGERRLDEHEVSWLPGYARSKPVRTGNAAVRQLQLDVYGETLDAFYVARRAWRRAERRDMGARTLSHLALGKDLAPAGRRHPGGPRRKPALHALQSNGLGRVRPSDPLC
jgi:GH15 family glucan-1,4-alpha-glucosidase